MPRKGFSDSHSCLLIERESQSLSVCHEVFATACKFRWTSFGWLPGWLEKQILLCCAHVAWLPELCSVRNFSAVNIIVAEKDDNNRTIYIMVTKSGDGCCKNLNNLTRISGMRPMNLNNVSSKKLGSSSQSTRIWRRPARPSMMDIWGLTGSIPLCTFSFVERMFSASSATRRVQLLLVFSVFNLWGFLIWVSVGQGNWLQSSVKYSSKFYQRACCVKWEILL